jgi:hypothetical protein
MWGEGNFNGGNNVSICGQNIQCHQNANIVTCKEALDSPAQRQLDGSLHIEIKKSPQD